MFIDPNKSSKSGSVCRWSSIAVSATRERERERERLTDWFGLVWRGLVWFGWQGSYDEDGESGDISVRTLRERFLLSRREREREPFKLIHSLTRSFVRCRMASASEGSSDSQRSLSNGRPWTSIRVERLSRLLRKCAPWLAIRLLNSRNKLVCAMRTTGEQGGHSLIRSCVAPWLTGMLDRVQHNIGDTKCHLDHGDRMIDGIESVAGQST